MMARAVKKSALLTPHAVWIRGTLIALPLQILIALINVVIFMLEAVRRYMLQQDALTKYAAIQYVKSNHFAVQ